jgi:DNA-binding NtrC family response regulator
MPHNTVPGPAEFLVFSESPVRRLPRRALVVEPDGTRLLMLQQAIRDVVRVDACADFGSARTQLFRDPPDMIVANLRLGAYNGLHLVHIAPPSTRSIVYMDREDPLLLREAQRAGAFVESLARLPSSVVSYMETELPSHDRRDCAASDRRLSARGGRRAADVTRSSLPKPADR